MTTMIVQQAALLDRLAFGTVAVALRVFRKASDGMGMVHNG